MFLSEPLSPTLPFLPQVLHYSFPCQFCPVLLAKLSWSRRQCLTHTKSVKKHVHNIIWATWLTWYACNVILNSSLTLSSNNPLSVQLIVDCLINSSKHWAYNSLRTYEYHPFIYRRDHNYLYSNLTNSSFSRLSLLQLEIQLLLQVHDIQPCGWSGADTLSP